MAGRTQGGTQQVGGPSIQVSERHPGRERRENGVDAPPNAVSPHHPSLSHVDGQQTRTQTGTDAETVKITPEHQADGQDNPHERGQPTSP